MITVVVGKEIEKIKGDFESYLNGLNMVGEISYSQYSKLYDEGTKQIQKAYELGKSELELKIKKLTQHLEPQSMTALFEQVEEEVKHEQRIKELESQIEKMKCCENCNNTWNGYHLNVCDDCKNHNRWELRR